MPGYRQETPETDPKLAPVKDLQGLIAAGKIAERDLRFATDLVNSCLAGHPTPGRLEWVSKLIERTKVQAVAVVDPVVTELETLIGKLPYRDQAFARDLIGACKTGHGTPNRMVWVNKLRDRAVAADEKTKAQTAYDRIALGTGLKASTIKRVVKRLAKDGRSVDQVLAAMSNKPALAHMAKEYGDEHHECCFCGIDLTDERSTSKGYGPICARKYQLPWGDEPVNTTPKELSHD